MKKTVMKIVLILLLATVAAGNAQVREGAYSLTPFIGGYTFEGNEDLKTSLTYGLRGGYHYTPNWGVEAFLNYVPTENKGIAGNPDVDLFGYGVEGLYHFMPESRLVPFLAVGLGGARYSGSGAQGDRNKFLADYGAGLKWFVTEDVALRADVRHVITFNDRYNDLLYTVGLNFLFGGAKKTVAQAEAVVEPTPEPEPVGAAAFDIPDADGDGVPDYMDKCPETPAGVKVDEFGCPPEPVAEPAPEPEPVGAAAFDIPDTDGDGVPDYMDKCPETPAGVKVDEFGCPPPVVEEKPAAMEAAIMEKGRVTLNVEFDFDKAIVKNKYHDEIGNLAAVMEKHPDLTIVIEGHTDNVGGIKYNQQLSERRANAVKKYLVDKFGIDATRLSAVGYGESRPIASNATKAGRQQNRRVEAAAEYTITK